MAEPQAYEPEKLTAGVTWKWKKTLSDYPASEWSLCYYLRKDGAGISTFNASADGDTFETTVTAAISAVYAAGVYDFIGIVSKGSEKYLVFDGIVEVLPNPTASAAYDPRTHARRVLDLIEAANRVHPHSRLGFQQSPEDYARRVARPGLLCAGATPPL